MTELEAFMGYCKSVTAKKRRGFVNAHFTLECRTLYTPTPDLDYASAEKTRAAMFAGFASWKDRRNKSGARGNRRPGKFSATRPMFTGL